MSSSKLPDQIAIPSKIKLKEDVQGIGLCAGITSAACLYFGHPLVSLVAAALCVGCYWGASTIKTHKKAVGEGKVYR